MTKFIPVPEGSERDSDLLHVVIQNHIQGCRQCTDEVENKVRGFGQRSAMCTTYFSLIGLWSDGEITDG